MKFLIILSVTVACVAAIDADARIISTNSDVLPDGTYGYSYETDNGISAQEQGSLKKVNSESASIEATGGYRYTAPDGTPVQVDYIANENGFQPQGSLLPTSPPIPPLIQRALQWIAAHPPKEESIRITA